MYDEASDFGHHRGEIDAVLAVLESIGRPLRPEMIVLDLGAGQGMHAGLLANIVGKVYCADIIDYSSLYGGEFLKLLKEKHERHGYAFPLEKVAFHQADAMNLHFRDAFFDAVISINSFEHIPDPRRALWETIRTTKPGGLIFISTDPIWTADTGSHFFHRVPEPWAHLVYADEEFIAKMKANGAPESELSEFKWAMNRWRAASYRTAVDDVAQRALVKVAHHDSWSGVVDEAHRHSENLRRLEERGLSEEELLVRGLRWVCSSGNRRPRTISGPLFCVSRWQRLQRGGASGRQAGAGYTWPKKVFSREVNSDDTANALITSAVVCMCALSKQVQ